MMSYHLDGNASELVFFVVMVINAHGSLMANDA
jgi:hypothetical protein